MPRKAIVPKELQAYYDDWQMAPGHLSGAHLFLTGFTGAGIDDSMPADPEAQMRQALDKIGFVLREAGLDFGALVEMTSYHVGLRKHFDLFRSVRADYMQEPYPAWTAIEVAGFVHEAAIVEIRAIARSA